MTEALDATEPPRRLPHPPHRRRRPGPGSISSVLDDHTLDLFAMDADMRACCDPAPPTAGGETTCAPSVTARCTPRRSTRRCAPSTRRRHPALPHRGDRHCAPAHPARGCSVAAAGRQPPRGPLRGADVAVADRPFHAAAPALIEATLLEAAPIRTVPIRTLPVDPCRSTRSTCPASLSTMAPTCGSRTIDWWSQSFSMNGHSRSSSSLAAVSTTSARPDHGVGLCSRPTRTPTASSAAETARGGGPHRRASQQRVT